jgi:hypothetical protein
VLRCCGEDVLRLRTVAATGLSRKNRRYFRDGRGNLRRHIDRMIMRLSNLNQAVA